jgi:hypothetical protein
MKPKTTEATSFILDLQDELMQVKPISRPTTQKFNSVEEIDKQLEYNKALRRMLSGSGQPKRRKDGTYYFKGMKAGGVTHFNDLGRPVYDEEKRQQFEDLYYQNVELRRLRSRMLKD